ncbi:MULTISPECIES: sporulation protein YunB [Paenibacillus]|uniref:sporulation protein YunB n=1 Tax=Paenibacillus TaxID=44249 RepID=UPI00038FA484|nr:MULTISPECIES: sporulation protein YunB [Paenibacillus]CDN42274.1 Sporulation protein YunB [Paenibacillus sp. P22]
MARWGRRVRWKLPVAPAKRMRMAKPRASGGWRPGASKPPAQWRPSARTASRRMSAVRVQGRTPPSVPRPRKIRKRWWLLFLALLVLAGTVNAYVFVERKLQPPLMRVAQIKVKQIMTEAINKAITEQVASGTDLQNLIDWKTGDNGKIAAFMMNYNEHMKITAQTVQTVQSTLKDSDKFKEGIPIGQAFGSALLSSFGPRIPVRFEPLGDAQVELGTRKSDAGINMVLVEVYIRIKTELAVIIPFDSSSQSLETEIPVSYLMVVGDVPSYYYDGKGNPVGDAKASAPALALPPVPTTPETAGGGSGQH